MKPSFSFLFSGLFLFFILHSIWNLISIFRTPFCTEGEVCYKSYLNSKPSLDLLVFISDSSKSGDFDLILRIDGFDYSKPFDREISVDLAKTVRNNGSLVIHTLLLPTKFRRELNIRDLINSPGSTYLKSYLTKYAIPLSATFNLLKDETKKHSSFKPVTHIRSKYAIVMCSEDLNIPHTSIPVEIIRHLKFNNQKQFLPIIHRDIMQMRLKDLVEITEDMTSTNFSFIYNPISYGKLRFLLQIDSTLYQFIDLGFSEKDLDEVKSVFADTNLYLLCMTVFIGSIHLLLDFLSFKNDVSFWKTQKSMAGLSTRTVFWRAFSQTVIFFYLLDEGTSLLVIIPSGIATLIEFWKVSKILKTTISWRNGLKFNKDSTESQEEMKTREYDEECMQYLSYVLYPLCFSAAVYSLLYQPHKSWYSWTISSLVNGVYAFGFLFMLPQLFINYRLKSVAALPWRAFTYRAFNTFIDDIFAFIITMPTAHRLACFRDDVVFLVYLYQRWLYPVDKSRRDDLAPGEDNKMAETKEDKKKK